MSIRGCLSVRPRAVLEADPGREHFNFFNWHFSGYDRKKSDAGLQHYIPCNLGEIGDYYRRFIDPPDIMVIQTRPIDADGYFNFGASNLWHRAIASRAKVVIVEVNPALPHVHGIDNGLHASEVDYVIEGHGEPPPELPNSAPTDADRAVAQLIATRDRGRRVPPDRHRRDAERCVLLADGQRCARSRRAHRDAHRRDHRPLPSRHRDGRDGRRRIQARSSAASASVRGRSTRRSTTTRTSRASRSSRPTCRTSSCRTTG